MGVEARQTLGKRGPLSLLLSAQAEPFIDTQLMLGRHAACNTVGLKEWRLEVGSVLLKDQVGESQQPGAGLNHLRFGSEMLV